MNNTWAHRVLHRLQVDKHVQVLQYLQQRAPGRWKSLEELDAELPDGARLADFPAEWTTEMIRECARRGSPLKIEVVRAGPPITEEPRLVRLRYDPVTIHSADELLDALRATARGGEVASLSIGGNLILTPAGRQAVVDCVRQRTVVAIPLNSLVALGRKAGGRFATAAGAALGGDGGRSQQQAEHFVDWSAWMKGGGPVELRFKLLAARGVKMSGVGLPTKPLQLTDRVQVMVRRTKSIPDGDAASTAATGNAAASQPLRVTFRVTGGNDGGLSIVPAQITFPPDNFEPKLLELKPLRAGAYTVHTAILGAATAVAREYRTELRTEVTIDATSTFEVDTPARLFPRELQCPLPLPPSHLLPTLHMALRQPSAASGETWWSDPAPRFAAILDSVTVSAADLAIGGATGIVNAGPSEAADADDGGADGADAIKKKRAKNVDDLANKHMLRLGFDFTKPYNPAA